MNLVAYDKVESLIDKSKSWIDIKNKKLLSRELPYRKYISFGKRFDKINGYTYYIILTDDNPTDRTYNKLIIDSSGKICINLKNIWNELNFNKNISYINVYLTHTDTTDDGDIFEIGF